MTGQMTAVGLYLLTDKDGVIRGAPATAEERKAAVLACARKHGLPVLYIPNEMSQAGT